MLHARRIDHDGSRPGGAVVGIGIAAFGLINDMGDRDWSDNVGDGMLAIAVIPATIGLAFLVLSFFNKNKD